MEIKSRRQTWHDADVLVMAEYDLEPLHKQRNEIVHQGRIPDTVDVAKYGTAAGRILLYLWAIEIELKAKTVTDLIDAYDIGAGDVRRGIEPLWKLTPERIRRLIIETVLDELF